MRPWAPIAARLVCACLAVCCVWPGAAAAHGGDARFESEVTSLTPPVRGLLASVPAGGTHLQITNHTGRLVVVEGYDGEPFARILPDGTVQLNMNSPAVYLNRDAMGNVSVPAQAKPSARPMWQTQDRTGTYQWHDHRIHWMGVGVPDKVKDESRRTLISNWTVPMSVGTESVTVHGSLWWVGQERGIPPGALVAFVVLGLMSIGVLSVALQRRNRRR